MNIHLRHRLLTSTAAAVTFTLAACGGGTTGAAASGTTSPTSATATSDAPPSMPMTSGAAGATTGSAAVSTDHNDADVQFAQMMIVHHQGAIEMSELAPDRAQSQQVKDLAARIAAAQGPEIDQMNSWLSAWGTTMSGGMMADDPTSTDGPDDRGGMDHGDGGHGDMGMGGSSEQSSEPESSTRPGAMPMPGMMTADQMQRLQSASGAAFDTMFLELMVAHHQGAVEMADTELADGGNAEAVALAQKITTDQTAEIAEMQTLLQSR